MKNNFLKILGYSIIAGAVLYVAFGSGDEKNSSTTNVDSNKEYSCITCGLKSKDQFEFTKATTSEYYFCNQCYHNMMERAKLDAQR